MEEHPGYNKERHHLGEGAKRKGHKGHPHGAKTFRRGRAIAFLDRMNMKRSTLKQQLETPELQSINPILVGELKAIDMVINEFMQVFELHESEVMEVSSTKETETHTSSSDQEEEIQSDESN